MKERPILFSGEMVRAILNGRKSQTRRVIQPKGVPLDMAAFLNHMAERVSDEMRCPYGVPGDRLWVRETWKAEELEDGLDGIRYRADGAFRAIENTREASELWLEARREGNPWRPSIFMPRWASRITLEVVSIRAERVQEISQHDCLAEGMEPKDYTPRADFKDLWDRINRPRGFGWSVNPWVWVVEFKVV